VKHFGVLGDLEWFYSMQLVGNVSIMMSLCRASSRTTIELNWVVVWVEQILQTS
jgi:hypothetical protein